MKRGFIRTITELFKGMNNPTNSSCETSKLLAEKEKTLASNNAVETYETLEPNKASGNRQAQYSVYQSLWLFELASQSRNAFKTPMPGAQEIRPFILPSSATKTLSHENLSNNEGQTASLCHEEASDTSLKEENIYSDDGSPEDSDCQHTGLSEEEINKSTQNLMSFLFGDLSELADEFNRLIVDIPEVRDMRISTTSVSEVKECLPGLDTDGKPRVISYYRCRLASSVFSLSMRGKAGQIEFYLVPASEVLSLSLSEKPARRKIVVQLHDRYNGVWTFDKLPIDTEELRYLNKGLFKKLIVTSYEAVAAKLEGSEFQKQEEDNVKTTLSRLLSATQNMAQKIVSQQEEIQYRIARDLHDAVMADIMMLKRSLTGDKILSAKEIVETLDNVSERLREVCHDLAPRDLKDWGLRTVIEDLIERLGNRTGIDCSFICPYELPELPHPVQLHIYRIIQESLSNIEKYAAATKITVSIEVTEASIRIVINENGKGFSMPDIEARKLREGGSGLSSINERAAMIQCFYPAQIKIDSQPEHGSRTVLQIKLTAQ